MAQTLIALSIAFLTSFIALVLNLRGRASAPVAIPVLTLDMAAIIVATVLTTSSLL